MIPLFSVNLIKVCIKESNPKFIRIVSYFPVQISFAQIGIRSTSKMSGVGFRVWNRFISIQNAKMSSCCHFVFVVHTNSISSCGMWWFENKQRQCSSQRPKESAIRGSHITITQLLNRISSIHTQFHQQE